MGVILKTLLSASCALALALTGAPARVAAQDQQLPQPIRAEYANPTDRYPHNIMGNLAAHTDLIVALAPCADCRDWPATLAIRLPETLVFEDFAPRLLDLDGDGRSEIVVVESDQAKGSRLAVWTVTLAGETPKLVRGATTDFIGTRFRWLAPIGAADFDGDGTIDLAYVEKPHLDKILHIVRPEGTRLERMASVKGVTNHAIGQEEVQSRIELCAGVPTIFALDGTGETILSIQMKNGTAQLTALGRAEIPYRLDDGPLCNR